MGVKSPADGPKHVDKHKHGTHAKAATTATPAPAAAPTPTTTAAAAKPTEASPAPWAVKMIDINGVPRRTEMRMGTDPASMAAQNSMPIACPVLGALVKEGKLHVDANGRVQTQELLDALKERGLTPQTLEALRGISYFANSATDIAKNRRTQTFDIMHLRSGLTMHDSDSNILSTGRFDQAAFDRFASHAQGGYLDASAFAAAVKDQTAQDVVAAAEMKLDDVTKNPLSLLSLNHRPETPLLFGQNAVLAEYPVLLKLFNSKDPSGNPAISVDALKAFWKDGVLPPEAAPPDSIGVINTAEAYAKMGMSIEPSMFFGAFQSLATSTGLSNDGVRLMTTDGGNASCSTANASMGAGTAVKCPYLGGSMPMMVPATANLEPHVK